MNDITILKNFGVNVEKSLELFGTIDVYDETLNDFLAEIDNKLENLKKYKEAEDPSNYAIFAHSLKSDAKYFGFDKLSDLALEHEMAGKENNVKFISENYDFFVNEINKVVEISKKYLGVSKENGESVFIMNKDKSILVVDDSKVVVNFSSKVFANDYNIIAAANGEEAIQYLFDYHNLNIIAVLLDLNMPVVNGFQVLDYIKENNLFNKIGVSIITGAEDQESITKAFNYPIVDVLKKPFDEQSVKDVLEKTINSKEW